MASVLVEACVETLEESLAAEAAGAGRLELCAGLVEGGTTPSVGLIEAVRSRVGVPVFVMVRPWGGDFTCDADAVAIMLRDARLAIDAGAQGIVSGALTQDGRVDTDTTRRLVEQVRPLPFTFHRAIDLVRDLDEAFDALPALGVARVLTSAGAETARAGASRLHDLVQRLGGRLTIMAGGGVRAAHAVELVRQSGVTEVHARPLAPRPRSALPGPFVARRALDPAAIRALVEAVRAA